MSFSFTDEQMQFRAVLRRFLEAKSPPSEVRRLMETEHGYDRAVWRQLCEELGVAGLYTVSGVDCRAGQADRVGVLDIRAWHAALAADVGRAVDLGEDRRVVSVALDRSRSKTPAPSLASLLSTVRTRTL